MFEDKWRAVGWEGEKVVRGGGGWARRADFEHVQIFRHFSDEWKFFPLQIPSTFGAIVHCVNKIYYAIIGWF